MRLTNSIHFIYGIKLPYKYRWESHVKPCFLDLEETGDPYTLPIYPLGTGYCDSGEYVIGMRDSDIYIEDVSAVPTLSDPDPKWNNELKAFCKKYNFPYKKPRWLILANCD